MNDENKNNPKAHAKDVSKHPKTGALGEHPVGVGLGAIGAGAAVGAAGGAIAGPVGAVAGAAAGAVVGGLAGKAAAEAIDPTVEASYWRETCITRPYFDKKLGFEHYQPAYRYGWESYDRHGADRGTFSNVEADLARGWEKAKGTSRLAWDQAKSATRDAWDRAESRAHGPSVQPIVH